MLQFFKEDNGQFSSARLLAFLSVLSFIIDWQKCIWCGIKFEPTMTTIAFVLGVVGFKTLQKFGEN
jgi:hypothetical protein